MRCDGTEPSWNQFVEECRGASVFHLYEWKNIIERTYGHRSFYLIARERERVVGLLPLFLIDSSLFGRALVSMPFADYGGTCDRDRPEASTRLLEEAVKLGRSLSVDYLQLRQTPLDRVQEPRFPGLSTYTGKVTMLLELNADVDAVWKQLPSERRNRIRKARKMDVSARWEGVRALDAFYEIFSENMRDLGSPVHSKVLFQEMLDLPGNTARILLVEHQKNVIGAALCLFFQKTILIPWVSSLRRCFRLYPNVLLYWTAIQHGCENGYRVLDFGRSSRDSGTYEFKRQWGARPVTLSWQVFSFRGKRAPDFSEAGLKQRLLVSCWRRLPLAVTRYVGPRLRGSIPA